MVEIPRLIVVGYGNMGRAVVRGVCGQAVNGGGVKVQRVLIVDPTMPEQADLPAVLRNYAKSLREVDSLQDGDVILLAVKPQVFGSIGADLQRLCSAGARVTVLSVMAGVTCEAIQRVIGGGTPVVRAMPNLAAGIGLSASAFSAAAGTADPHADTARAILGCIGPTVNQIGEHQMDAYTAVAGSGPAYLFLLAEAMVEGAVEAGLDRQAAVEAVRQTLDGAASLLRSDPRSPQALRAAVTSKGGTTEAALGVLNERRVKDAVISAINAARLRASELSRS